MTATYDLIVLGTGIAGLSVAREAAKSQLSVLIVDNKGVAAGASGTPAGLLNPATGRFAKLSWNAITCFEQTAELIEEAYEGQPSAQQPTRGILRPALDEEIARGMQSNLSSDPWPDGWAEWLTPDQLSELDGGINSEFGALFIPNGYGLDIGDMLRRLKQTLSSKQVSTAILEEYELVEDGDHWLVKAGSDLYKAETVVTASGVSTMDHSHWSGLPLHPVKGQVAVFETDQPHGVSHAFSSIGYGTPISDNRIGMGSTYEHHFDDRNPDQDGAVTLEEKLVQTLPFLAGKVSLVNQWAGVRASTPNYKPFVGPHPHVRNLHILAGLGSKGLLYGPYAASKLVAAITAGDYSLIPDLLHAKRAYNKMGYKPTS